MISRMHLVQNAARLAMADHRAATLRRPRRTAVALLKALAQWLTALFAGSRPSAAD